MVGGTAVADLPLYNPKANARSNAERRFLETVWAAAGLIASPGYHGAISGVVKNALDLIEEKAQDARSYLSDLPVGLIVTAYVWQATGSTIAALRSVVQALRGWPTPFAAGINSATVRFDGNGGATNPAAVEQFERIGRQIAWFIGTRSERTGATRAGAGSGAGLPGGQAVPFLA